MGSDNCYTVGMHKHSRIEVVFLLVLLIVLASCGTVVPPRPAPKPPVLYAPTDGMGIYEYCPVHRGQVCLDHLARMASGGFSLVVNYQQLSGNAEQEMAYAAFAAAHHMKIIWSLDDAAFWLSPHAPTTYRALAASCRASEQAGGCESNEEVVRYFIALVAPLAATWGYYVGDEVPGSEQAPFRDFSQMVHETDPAHPRLFVTYSPVQLSTFADDADVLAVDDYPLGLPGRSVDEIAGVAAAVERIAQAHHTTAGMVLQAHNLGRYPQYAPYCEPFPSCMPDPTQAQMRAMRLQVEQHMQPRVVLWYSYFDVAGSDNPATRWQDLVSAAGK